MFSGFAMAWRVNHSRATLLKVFLPKSAISKEYMTKVSTRNSAFNLSAYHGKVRTIASKSELLTQTNRVRILSPANIHVSVVCEAKIQQFTLSDIGEGIREVTVKEWFVKVNDHVNQFDNICEVQSDKASVTITSRFSGVIKKLYCDIDEIIAVGNPLCDIEIVDSPVEVLEDADSDAADSQNIPDASTSDISSGFTAVKKVLTTPAVRRLAMENQLKLSDIPGTGKDGRILKEDVLAFISGVATSKTTVQTTASQYCKPIPKIKEELSVDKVVPVTGFVKVMARTMKASLTIPHFVYSDEIDVSSLIAVRLKLKHLAEDQGVKLTYLPFFVKATSMAMSMYPIVNSSVDEACENITYKAQHNIGIAMDTPSGLAVPNVKNVQSMTLFEVAKEVNRLHNEGLKGTLQPADVTGGTFTLSNIGAIGGTYTKPVILPPEVAIMALGKIQTLPRFNERGEVVKASILSVSWAADHRILDGATIARFSNTWKEYIENPATMLLNMK